MAIIEKKMEDLLEGDFVVNVGMVREIDDTDRKRYASSDGIRIYFYNRGWGYFKVGVKVRVDTQISRPTRLEAVATPSDTAQKIPATEVRLGDRILNGSRYFQGYSITSISAIPTEPDWIEIQSNHDVTQMFRKTDVLLVERNT